MNRQYKHQVERSSISGRLRRMGFDVQEVARNGKYDMLVNGHVRVALRVAFPGRYAHTVTVNGRRYAYDYRSWNFNFHRHGRWDRKYCDVFVCVAKHRRSADEIFVIPSSAVTGPTFSLHGAGKAYRGRYAAFRNRWGVFNGQRAHSEATPKVACAAGRRRTLAAGPSSLSDLATGSDPTRSGPAEGSLTQPTLTAGPSRGS